MQPKKDLSIKPSSRDAIMQFSRKNAIQPKKDIQEMDYHKSRLHIRTIFRIVFGRSVGIINVGAIT